RGSYPQEGVPENISSFPGTRLRIADSRPAIVPPTAPAKPLRLHRVLKRAVRHVRPAKVAQKLGARRPAAFVVRGAPKEPMNEISLPARAHLLGAWVAAHPKPTNANVRHWLYQHAWIVDGAAFGWWHGAQALHMLIGVDRKVEARWGIGRRSEAVARAALVRV